MTTTAVGDPPVFVLTFRVVHSVELTVDQVWPDGDAPPDPTEQDVRDAVQRAGGAGAALRSWGLDRECMNESSMHGDAVVSSVGLRICRSATLSERLRRGVCVGEDIACGLPVRLEVRR